MDGLNRMLPLSRRKLNLFGFFVKVCLNIEHPLHCQDHEAALVHSPTVFLNDKAVELVAVFKLVPVNALDVQLRFKELLPKH